MEETKRILLQNPPHSYLFRRVEKGTVTIASLNEKADLLEIPIMNCDCKACPERRKDYKTLEKIVELFDQATFSHNSEVLQLKQPVSRKVKL